MEWVILTGFVPEFSGRKLQEFLRESLTSKRHYDQIAADLILAEGAMDESGAVNFLLRYNAEPTPLAGAVSQKFLGLTLQFARTRSARDARRVFFGSITYLPVLWILMIANKL